MSMDDRKKVASQSLNHKLSYSLAEFFVEICGLGIEWLMKLVLPELVRESIVYA